ncbi:hypothetical protein ACFW5D_34385 [Streptomyces sp. NPDC058770]|uniref:hypothetical protein n=1 Tax=unclassified Streptomyces TaxID=2593676 RepID=UPI0036CF89D4
MLHPSNRRQAEKAPRKNRFGARFQRGLNATGTWLDTPGGRAALAVIKLLLTAASIGVGHHPG